VAKILVTRGAGGRGYAPSASRPTRIVAAFDAPRHPPERTRDGVRVRRCALVLSEQPWLAGAKTLNRLENVLARAEWEDADIHEGLLCDAAGRLVEGTMSNVFLGRGGALVTPALTRCGVAGAQRERVLELLDAAGTRCEIRDIPYGELAQADEVFLTNSVIGVWPVTRIDERTLGVGAITRAAQRAIEADDARA
jgi:4-amino-4-deoxychorismate lyase